MISDKTIEEIVNKIIKNYNPERIYLFGSYANGSPNENSDLDFIIVKHTDKPKHKRGREVRKYLMGLMVPIDLKVYTPNEFESERKSGYTFLNSIMKETKLSYEREA